MTTRAMGDAAKAWRAGFKPFMKYCWEKEAVILVSIGLFMTLPIGYMVTPQSRIDRIQAEHDAYPSKYPFPKRYIEGKTGPPTSV